MTKTKKEITALLNPPRQNPPTLKKERQVTNLPTGGREGQRINQLLAAEEATGLQAIADKLGIQQIQSGRLARLAFRLAHLAPKGKLQAELELIEEQYKKGRK
jgi:hypothetical protein